MVKAMQRTDKGPLARTRLLDFDPVALSAFRIALALYLIYHFLVMLPDYDLLFTDNGLIPRALLASLWKEPGSFSLLAFGDAPLFHMLFLTVHVAAAIAFGFGYKTRFANGLLLITCISLYRRNPIALGTHATLLPNLLLLWSLFLPLNRYWSIDAALDPLPRVRDYPKLPLLALKLQVAYIYFFSALFKLAGITWLNGTAISFIFQDNEAGGFPVDWWLSNHAQGLLVLATYATVAFQAIFVFLVYSPFYNDFTRCIAFAAALSFHVIIMLTLEVGSFPQICFCYLVLLVPDAGWAKLFAKRRRRLAQVKIVYNAHCGECRKFLLILREFCLPPATPVVAMPDDAACLSHRASWGVYDEYGAFRVKGPALSYILRQSPVFFPLAWLMRYEFIRKRKRLFTRVAATAFKEKTQPACGVYSQAICAVLAVLALGSNILLTPCPLFFHCRNENDNWRHSKAATIFLDIASLFQVRQDWGVFAPNPSHTQIEAAIDVHYPDGSRRSYLQSQRRHMTAAGMPALTLPRNLYLYRLAGHKEYLPEVEAFAATLCRQINSASAPQLKAVSIDVKLYYLRVDSEWSVETARRSFPALNNNYPCPYANEGSDYAPAS